MEELLALKGVGRKTANLVLTIGFGKPGHLRGHPRPPHQQPIGDRRRPRRRSRPSSPSARSCPGRHWIPYNDLLVTFGQNVCKPISPLCSMCPVAALCQQIGVGKRR